MKVIKLIMCLMAAATSGCRCLRAQEAGVCYTTEIQTDYAGRYNWVNLLRLDFSGRLCQCASVDVATISIAKTSESRLADDLLTFSNIEEDNLPLALAMLGIKFRIGKSSLFAGIRNLNEDYFNSHCTSLFTNSSCGIFPTLSANYRIANYPFASLGLHYGLETGRWNIAASLYNGKGYRNFSGRENVFRFSPISDGMLGVTSINYNWNDSGYYCGLALHYGEPAACQEADKREISQKEEKTLNSIIWGYAEQRLADNLWMVLQYSANLTERTGCRSYAGAGLVIRLKETEGGVVLTCADFSDTFEYAAEITWKIPCFEKGFLQPALHLIRNSNGGYLVGLLRFSYELGN